MDTACWKIICLGTFLLIQSCSAYSYLVSGISLLYDSKTKMVQKLDLSSSLDGRVGSTYCSLQFNIKNYSHLVENLYSCKVVENVLSLEPI